MSAEEEELELEVNEKQGEFLAAVTSNRFKVAALVGGRGGGKSITLSDVLMIAQGELPKGKCGFGVKTIAKAKSKLTSGLKAGWRRWGVSEYDPATGEGDYVLWKEPPPGFDRPYEAPDNWSNCISWPNGFVIELESFKMASEENRGSNYDVYVIDEGLNFKKIWMKIVLPTLRANVGKFDSCFHHTLFIFSSPPWTPEGQYIYEYEVLAKKQPDRYYYQMIKTADNLQFLPADYVDTLKMQLTNLEFRVEVLGERISRQEHGFYPSFDRDVHEVEDEDDGVEDDVVMWEDGPFCHPGKAIVASLDFNALFTCGTLWQKRDEYSMCVGNVYVKSPDKGMTMAQTWAHRFVEEYKDHRRKQVTLTGDRNGRNRSAGSDKSMYEQVEAILEANGWDVCVEALTYNPPHKDKYTLVNDVLGERFEHLTKLRFDSIKAKATIISIENSPVEFDYSKDKESESSTNPDQERATHLSDTVDYYVVWEAKGGNSDQGGVDFDIGFL